MDVFEQMADWSPGLIDFFALIVFSFALLVARKTGGILNFFSPVSAFIFFHIGLLGVMAGNGLNEFQLDAAKIAEMTPGQIITAEAAFTAGQKVDVQGVSIGKGYAGTIKRYHFASGRASHGNSRSHNVPGSIGMAQDPGRVFPGKRMTGHLGDVTKTVQNLVIARIDAERNLIMVKGAIPGAPGGKVIVTPAVKTPLKKK